MLAGMHMTHCFFCSSLTQAARVASAQTLNVSNRHIYMKVIPFETLSSAHCIGVTFLSTVTCVVHIYIVAN